LSSSWSWRSVTSAGGRLQRLCALQRWPSWHRVRQVVIRRATKESNQPPSHALLCSAGAACMWSPAAQQQAQATLCAALTATLPRQRAPRPAAAPQLQRRQPRASSSPATADAEAWLAAGDALALIYGIQDDDVTSAVVAFWTNMADLLAGGISEEVAGQGAGGGCPLAGGEDGDAAYAAWLAVAGPQLLAAVVHVMHSFRWAGALAAAAALPRRGAIPAPRTFAAPHSTHIPDYALPCLGADQLRNHLEASPPPPPWSAGV